MMEINKILLEGVEIADIFDPDTNQHFAVYPLGMQDFARVAGYLGGVIKEVVANMKVDPEHDITPERVVVAFLMNLDHFATKFEENFSSAMTICTHGDFAKIRALDPAIWLQLLRGILTVNAPLFSKLELEFGEIKKKATEIWPGLFETKEPEQASPEVPEAESEVKAESTPT